MIIAVFAASFVWPVQAQTIKTLPRGEREVHFNNGCTVFYDNRDRRTHYQGCSGDQVQRADRAIAQSGGHGGGYQNNRPPRIVMSSSGRGEVIFRNDCIVYYNRNGSRDRASNACDYNQRRQADEAMARYRREQGYGSNNGAWQSRPPQVVIDYDGRGRVMYRDGCNVHYDRHGDRTGANSHCNRDQKRRADDVMARYRREQGYGGNWQNRSPYPNYDPYEKK